MKKVTFLLLLLLTSCGSDQSALYQIAIDPSWYQINVHDREKNLLGFTQEILTAIAEEEKIALELVMQSASNLTDGLQQNKYEAILSTLYPYNFNESKYAFSELFLATGPVLMTASDCKATSLKELMGKAVGVEQGSLASAILATHPTIIARNYPSIAQALNDLAIREIEGALIDILPAATFCRDLYHDILKIVTPPLTNQGIRLLTLKGEHPLLLQKFNKGLAKLRKDGRYHALQKKWQLDN